jgi:hypothetical protein
MLDKIIKCEMIHPSTKETAMPIDELDANEMRWEDFHHRRYQANLASHHDCRDPAHPGCELCEEDDEE